MTAWLKLTNVGWCVSAGPGSQPHWDRHHGGQSVGLKMRTEVNFVGWMWETL